ncbi:MAG: hypothetical protein QM581_06505 [Pseudomonas sp.]
MSDDQKMFDIANGLSLAMYRIKGLADLIEEADLIGRDGFPSSIQSGIEAIHIVAKQAITDYAQRI